jgi:hypothetical protein
VQPALVSVTSCVGAGRPGRFPRRQILGAVVGARGGWRGLPPPAVEASPRRPAAAGSGGMAHQVGRRLTARSSGKKMPLVSSAAGPCCHTPRRHPPLVAWGLCRHIHGGFFCQFVSLVILFVNELEQVVSFDKNSVRSTHVANASAALSRQCPVPARKLTNPLPKQCPLQQPPSNTALSCSNCINCSVR